LWSAIPSGEEHWCIEVPLCRRKYRSHPNHPVPQGGKMPSDACSCPLGDGLRPVWHCQNAPNAAAAVSALQPSRNIAMPCPDGLVSPPAWWTSRRKTKTVCAIFFRSVGPLRLKHRLSHRSPAAAADARNPSDRAARSGSTPMASGSMRGSSKSASIATRHGTERSSSAGPFKTSARPRSRRCSAAIRSGCERKSSSLMD
jgi:hypothetical protein